MVGRSCVSIMELLIGTCSFDVLDGPVSSGMVSSAACRLSKVVLFILFGMGLGHCFGRTDGYLDMLQ